MLVTLPHRALIAFDGPDWASFLNGQTTLNVEAAAQDSQKPLHYGAFLTPQGKLICDFFLWPRGAEQAWIDVPAPLRDELFTRLNLFKLRAKVTLSKPDASVYASLEAGDLPDPRHPGLYRAYGKDLPASDDLSAYDAFRLTAGLAEPVRDFPKEYLYPIDINLDLLGAIDFKKGCFVGQETTSRMKRRGTIKNRLIPLTHAHPRFEFGSEVLLGDRRAGEILASENGRSLALMRLDRLSDTNLTCADQPVSLAAPDWLKTHIAAPLIP